MRKRTRETQGVVGVAELKSRLSRYLERVKGGHELVVTEHGHPIARLVPLGARDGADARRERLIRKGLLVPAKKPLDLRFWAGDSPVKDPHGHVLHALLEEREESR